MAMTAFGERTPYTVIWKSESHKLNNAFNVAEGKNVYQGQNVVLLDDGTIRAWETGDESSRIIGIAHTDSIHPAYPASRGAGPIEVTVLMNGFAVVKGTAAAAINAGWVKPNGTRETTFNKYDNYVQATATEGFECIALNNADQGDLVQILIR